MNLGYLSAYFEGAAVKRLSAVDAVPSVSNQHEVGTTAAMRSFLGDTKHRFDVSYLWLAGEQESISEPGWATHYNTREKQPHRSPEWRLYYPSNPVTEIMSEGDTLFLAKRPRGDLLFIVTPQGSTLQNQLLYLFGFDSQPELRFDVRTYEGENDSELDFTTRFILDEIGIEPEAPDANSLDSIIERFGLSFPTTREFSDLARLTLPEVDPVAGPDVALMAWLDHEEAMFRRLERRIVSERLAQGFLGDGEVDVDGFIRYSLQVQNRRKSRMGRALENHLEALFLAHGLEFGTQATVERNNTADFIFPGVWQYHDAEFPAELLTVLAAKSSCKDRWRQVLAEADRIWPKHLVTLEPAISVAQTDQMQAERVRLTVPAPIQGSYTADQRGQILSLGDFISIVDRRQRAWK